MTSRRWLVAALVLTAVTSLVLLLALRAGEGPEVALVLAVPVLVCAVPVLTPSRLRRFAAWGSVVVLAAGVLISLASIGMFYVASVILLAVGAHRSRSASDLPGGVG
ncbi:hypothetical protein OHA21_11435 [Actinoplanes sp. NBC_00393]|uniref:hypothetical protein n=1 Tax=Actinoplanes sp. NBC_00393 TaxID=2975953 RepID=UPI002E224BEE